jgi:hypothetical protein
MQNLAIYYKSEAKEKSKGRSQKSVMETSNSIGDGGGISGTENNWCCYITVKHETRASENGICLTQQMRQMHNDLISKLLED